MATRQYIGARYVIKIYENSQTSGSAEWEADTSYEPLTMVTYQNSSYLSKKAVPSTVGNPASNTDYWIVTGAYNGQIAQLQSDVADLQSQIDNIGTRSFLFVGDSYGDQSGEWPYVVKSALGISNDNFHNVCVSGAGFVDYGSGTYLTQVTNYAGDKEAITDIVLCGGLNDSRYSTYANAESALNSAISAFNTYVRSNYPNAKIWCGFIGSCLYDSDYYTTVPLFNRKITRYLYEVAGSNNNWVILGGVSNAIHSSTSNFNSDHSHPSALGNLMIGHAIANILAGGQYQTVYPETSISNLASGLSGSFKATYEINGDVTLLKIGGQISATSLTLNESFVDVASLSYLTFPTDIDVQTNVTIDCGNGASPRYATGTATFRFTENKIKLRMLKATDTGSGYQSYSISNGSVFVNDVVTKPIPTFNVN